MQADFVGNRDGLVDIQFGHSGQAIAHAHADHVQDQGGNAGLHHVLFQGINAEVGVGDDHHDEYAQRHFSHRLHHAFGKGGFELAKGHADANRQHRELGQAAHHVAYRNLEHVTGLGKGIQGKPGQQWHGYDREQAGNGSQGYRQGDISATGKDVGIGRDAPRAGGKQDQADGNHRRRIHDKGEAKGD